MSSQHLASSCIRQQKGNVVMSTELLNSTDVCFNTHDNVFIRFMHRHPIRLARLDQELYFVARDIIMSLGYSSASIQHLTRKCPNKQKFEVKGRRGKTRVNIIPIRDVLSLIYKCPLETESVIELQNWIIEQAVITAKDYQILLQPKDVYVATNTPFASGEVS